MSNPAILEALGAERGRRDEAGLCFRLEPWVPRRGERPYELRVVVRPLWRYKEWQLAFCLVAIHNSGYSFLEHTKSLARIVSQANMTLRRRELEYQRRQTGSESDPYLQLEPEGVIRHLEELAVLLPRNLWSPASSGRPR